MNLTELQKYKHDTIGKFNVLKELIEQIDEENLTSNDSKEIIEAANDVFISMSKSSQKFLNHLDSVSR